MELELFKKIEEAEQLLENNFYWYQSVENKLTQYFDDLYKDSEYYIGYYSRIKDARSLKNKIVNNKYYLKYPTSQAILDNMVDVIGITLECRFKYDEKNIYNTLLENFKMTDQGIAQSIQDPRIFLDLNKQQPLVQKNGFSNYRIDGYYRDNGEKINFELQIRSLVNTFWSSVEHQVIYKNNNYVGNDHFMKDMLLSVKNSLDALDFQLNNIYQQMKKDEQESFGLYEKSMKNFLAKAIHDLFTTKLSKATNLELNLKQASAIISHYIYVCDFLRSDVPDQVMLMYLEHMNFLLNEEIDFHSPIHIDLVESDDYFINLLMNYFIEVMNKDYDWHMLFVMIFTLQEENNAEVLYKFSQFIKDLIINPTWFITSLDKLGLESEKEIIELTIVQALIDINRNEIIYESFLYDVMVTIRDYINTLEDRLKEDPKYYSKNKNNYLNELSNAIKNLEIDE